MGYKALDGLAPCMLSMTFRKCLMWPFLQEASFFTHFYTQLYLKSSVRCSVFLLIFPVRLLAILYCYYSVSCLNVQLDCQLLRTSTMSVLFIHCQQSHRIPWVGVHTTISAGRGKKAKKRGAERGAQKGEILQLSIKQHL